ncbi:hypothetical protein Y032_0601g517 [Ancylostoma ceylanicum]|uniref:Uncharacterized protein n=1 Tax=Ancylostoma ceylanicum TaxID=53326 RepID=A0A016WM90_9BILA|nr:hypothetical protein Y032_0601g517 [Ancylostoma ceylanicum]
MTEDIAVTKFRDYLRVNTEQPRPDYAECQKFLFDLADEIGITRKAIERTSRAPFIIIADQPRYLNCGWRSCDKHYHPHEEFVGVSFFPFESMQTLKPYRFDESTTPRISILNFSS